jgi:hypothetical protein
MISHDKRRKDEATPEPISDIDSSDKQNANINNNSTQV